VHETSAGAAHFEVKGANEYLMASVNRTLPRTGVSSRGTRLIAPPDNQNGSHRTSCKRRYCRSILPTSRAGVGSAEDYCYDKSANSRIDCIGAIGHRICKKSVQII
jgi:hypothetical protein